MFVNITFHDLYIRFNNLDGQSDTIIRTAKKPISSRQRFCLNLVIYDSKCYEMQYNFHCKRNLVINSCLIICVQSQYWSKKRIGHLDFLYIFIIATLL